jgi:uncharacterized protein (TIGR03083 family)
MALAEEERTDLLALLRDLTDEQWRAPSLCTEWSVRDVAAHVVSFDELSVPTLVGTFLRGGIKVSGVNAVALTGTATCGQMASSTCSHATCTPAGCPPGSGAASP